MRKRKKRKTIKNNDMDKFIVRISAIIANLYVPMVLAFAIKGIDISIYDYLFSTTVMFGVVLSVLVHSQGKYHCKWMRGLCYNCITVPATGYIDSMYDIFGDAIDFILAIALLWAFGIFYTLCEAVRHFIKVRRTIRRYEEYRIVK